MGCADMWLLSAVHTYAVLRLFPMLDATSCSCAGFALCFTSFYALHFTSNRLCIELVELERLEHIPPTAKKQHPTSFICW